MHRDIINHFKDKFVRVTYVAGTQARSTHGILRGDIGPDDGIQIEPEGTGVLTRGEQFLRLVSHPMQEEGSAVREDCIRCDTIVQIEVLDVEAVKRITAERVADMQSAGRITVPGVIPQG